MKTRKYLDAAGEPFSDAQFLWWIYNRLKNVHDENKNYDYMHRLRNIVYDLAREEIEDAKPPIRILSEEVEEALTHYPPHKWVALTYEKIWAVSDNATDALNQARIAGCEHPILWKTLDPNVSYIL